MLWSSGGEGVNLDKESSEDFFGRFVLAAFSGCDHALFAPFLVVVGHGFADAIGVQQQQVTRHQDQRLFGVRRVFEEAYYRAVGFESQDLRPTVEAAAQDDGWIVSG